MKEVWMSIDYSEYRRLRMCVTEYQILNHAIHFFQTLRALRLLSWYGRCWHMSFSLTSKLILFDCSWSRCFAAISFGSIFFTGRRSELCSDRFCLWANASRRRFSSDWYVTRLPYLRRFALDCSGGVDARTSWVMATGHPVDVEDDDWFDDWSDKLEE